MAVVAYLKADDLIKNRDVVEECANMKDHWSRLWFSCDMRLVICRSILNELNACCMFKIIFVCVCPSISWMLLCALLNNSSQCSHSNFSKSLEYSH